MVRTTSDKQISRTFQGFFQDKLQFSRTTIYSINRHSLTPFWTHYWLKHVMESFSQKFSFWSYEYMKNLYENCGVKNYMREEHRSYIRNFWSCEKKAWKNSGLYGIRTLNLCDTGAALYQLGAGARFSKVPIINGPGKLSPFTLNIEVSILLHLTW